MAIFLIYLSILFSYFLFSTSSPFNWYLKLVKSLIFNSLLIVLSSEIFSLFHQFNYQSLSLFWLLVTFSQGIIIYKRWGLSPIKNGIQPILNLFKTYKISYFFLIVILLLFIQGLAYPPNNWDSLTYHMARIPHWVENESIHSFTTHIYRQIYSPPLGELIVAQLCILSKSDLFANSVQLLFAIGCISSSIAIAKEFQFSRRAILIICLLIISTPELLLQCSSTQNDLIVSFFILTCILYCIKSYKELKLLTLLLVGLTAGLAFYTKGTAYIYLFPLFLVWGIILLLKHKKIIPLLKLAAIPLLILLINLGFYARNYSLSGDILGKNDDRLFNETFGIPQSILTTIKNIGNHLALPPFSNYTNQVVEKMHLVLGVPINDIATNFNGLSFKLEKWQHHEDTTSNFFQLLLFFIALLLFLKNRKKLPKLSWLLFLFPLVEFLLFSFILKWQPWHTRLQMPIFLMIPFFIAYIIDFSFKSIELFPKKLIIPFSFIVGYSVLVLLLNPTRPIISNSKVNVNDVRFKKYCANYLSYEKDFRLARFYLKKYEGKTGVEIGGDMWEYLLYYDIFSNHRKLGLPINVENVTNKISHNNKDLKCIISYKNLPLYSWHKMKFKKINSSKLFTIYLKEI